MPESVFESIHYELAHLNREFDGDIDKINARMRMVPEQFQFPFLKRELENLSHELSCEFALINLSKSNNIDDIAEREICCVVSDGRPSCFGLDYNLEGWKEACVLAWYNKCKHGLERGVLSHVLDSARKKLIKDLLWLSISDYPELFTNKTKDNQK